MTQGKSYQVVAFIISSLTQICIAAMLWTLLQVTSLLHQVVLIMPKFGMVAVSRTPWWKM